jgi:hypothetical protein
VVTEYRGERVSFEHQLWRVKPDTVCRDRRLRIDAFSRCTNAAQALFRNKCEELTRAPPPHPYARSLRAMFCNAADRFKPTRASIEWTHSEAGSSVSEECRLAKAALIVDKSRENRARRREACGE